MAIGLASPALDAYEAIASSYDTFTAGYEHDLWLRRIIEIARRHGLQGMRVLDAGTGTGKSAEPLVRSGYTVTAFDVSPSMAAIATRRLGPDADVLVADMRHLPRSLGPFDLVICLDDAINYLTDAEDLQATFDSVQRVLDARGLYVFDVNTLHGYASAFDQDFVADMGDTVFCWHAAEGTEGPARPGAAHVAQLDVFEAQGDDTWSRRTSQHRQRHFSDDQIQAALEDAGLRCLEVLGQAPGIRLNSTPDEMRDTKRVYVVGPAA
jgi:SAM-dependent methyltransferase